MKIADSMLDLIGDIPLVRLNRIGQESEAEILVKPEFLNPSGSIKDRIARMMIEAAEEQGKLRSGSTIVEASTGNTGTALAFVAAVKGYGRFVFSPEKVANRQWAAIMEGYGCEIKKVDTDGIIPDIFDSNLVDEVFTVTDEKAIEMAHRLAEEEGIFSGNPPGPTC